MILFRAQVRSRRPPAPAPLYSFSFFISMIHIYVFEKDTCREIKNSGFPACLVEQAYVTAKMFGNVAAVFTARE